MVVERRGIHRAHTLASTLPHWPARWRLPCWPARCGHPRHPLEGFGRVWQDKLGAGRGFLISSSATGACGACFWPIKSSPSMPAGG